MYSVEQLINIEQNDLESYSKEELRQRVMDMNRWVQKRISGFSRYHKNEGISRSPALVQYQKRGAEKLSYGPDVSDKRLREEYVRGMLFLKAESSKASAWDKIQSRIIKGIHREANIRIKKKDFDTFWEKYQKLIEARPDLGLPENKYEAFRSVAKMIYGREDLMKMIEKEVPKGGRATDIGDALTQSLTRELDDLYEQTIASQVDEIGGMFKLTKSRSVDETKRAKRRKSSIKRKGAIIDVDTDEDDVDTEFDDIF